MKNINYYQYNYKDCTMKIQITPKTFYVLIDIDTIKSDVHYPKFKYAQVVSPKEFDLTFFLNRLPYLIKNHDANFPPVFNNPSLLDFFSELFRSITSMNDLQAIFEV